MRIQPEEPIERDELALFLLPSLRFSSDVFGGLATHAGNYELVPTLRFKSRLSESSPTGEKWIDLDRSVIGGSKPPIANELLGATRLSHLVG